MALRIEDPTGSLPPVKDDIPTRSPGVVDRPAPQEAGPTPRRAPRAPKGALVPDDGLTVEDIDRMLRSALTTSSNRVPADIAAGIQQRAAALGVTVREVVLDAFVTALERPLEVHRESVTRVRRAEALARLDR